MAVEHLFTGCQGEHLLDLPMQGCDSRFLIFYGGGCFITRSPTVKYFPIESVSPIPNWCSLRPSRRHCRDFHLIFPRIKSVFGRFRARFSALAPANPPAPMHALHLPPLATPTAVLAPHLARSHTAATHRSFPMSKSK